MSRTHVRIFYPADPIGVVPGGIDTFLRGLIKWAPPELEFSLVGMSTDPLARPVGRWTRCELGSRSFEFFPALAVADAGRQSRIPLSLRYTAALLRHTRTLREGFDLFDFHRPEPSLLFAADGRAKNAFFHNDPAVIRLQASDNRWRHLPGFYDWLERRAVDHFNSVWCVRESGVALLRERYAAQAASIGFVPTWVDTDVFYPVAAEARAVLRDRMAHDHHLDRDAAWVVSVGRLDTQKDPKLMLAAFVRLCALGRRLAWLVVGDGVLRAELERGVRHAGVADRVRFLGLRSPAQIADVLRAADVFALSSAYEGMPMALLEALGSGLPAAVTDVGEVRRVLQPGRNGAIATARDPVAFAAALAEVLDGAVAMRGAPSLAAVAPFRPEDVLAPVYANYRTMGRELAALRLTPEARAGEPGRRAVVGVPIDLLDHAGVVSRLFDWAQARQSSYVCFVNVHSAIHASFDERHRLSLQRADMAAPDGAPIAWTLRMKGHAGQRRVDGPGMMWRLCAHAEVDGVKVGLYGSSQATLSALTTELLTAFPKLEIGYAHSPPYREPTEVEDDAVCRDIERSGIGLLFVGLGCPKQEYWMARHRGRVPAVMLGVGAAFEFHAGTAARAPRWMRERGLEWLHRMWTQPRRLWRRYVFSNSLFIARTAREAMSSVAHKLRLPSTRSSPPNYPDNPP
jgi:exopolysaccharide biosynthesis WecB/TagA/CpsF family protein